MRFQEMSIKENMEMEKNNAPPQIPKQIHTAEKK